MMSFFVIRAHGWVPYLLQWARWGDLGAVGAMGAMGSGGRSTLNR